MEEEVKTPEKETEEEVKETEVKEQEIKDKKSKKEEKKENEIIKLKAEVEEFKDKYYRTLADLDNQRKQYAKEYQSSLKYASQNLAEKLIPSFEMFSTVLENKDKYPAEVQPFVAGFDMIYRQMVSELESEGVFEIKVKLGDKFDHSIHYAMETEEVEDKEQVDKIVKIMSKGYKIHDRLLKPVTVVVGKLKEIKEDKKEEENKEDSSIENKEN